MTNEVTIGNPDTISVDISLYTFLIFQKKATEIVCHKCLCNIDIVPFFPVSCRVKNISRGRHTGFSCRACSPVFIYFLFQALSPL